MAGIPFLSRILALAGIKVRNASLNAPTGKEVNITVSPLQVGDSIDVDLPNISGRLVTSTEVIPATDKSSTPTGVPNGVANLDSSGKIHVEQLPPLAITDVFVVNNETERLALDAQVGDVAIQLDNSTTWMLTALPASTASNWTQISNADYIHEIVTPTATLTGPSVTLDAATLEAVDINGDTMTGVLTMGPIGTLEGETGQIAFKELAPGNHSVTLRAPDTLADYVILTLPEDHGSAGQVLSTQGSSGILEWIDNSAAGAVLTVNGEPGPDVVLDASDVGAVAKAGDTMTGNLTMGPTGTLVGQTGEIRFAELAIHGTDYVGFKAPDSITTPVIWTLPAVDGSAGQVLKTSGSTPGAEHILTWGSLTTDDVAQGSTNLYFTVAYAQTAIYGRTGDLNPGFVLISSGAGKVTESAITTTKLSYLTDVTGNIQAQIDGKVSKSGDTMTGALTMNAQNEIRFADADSSNYVGFKADSDIASNFIWTLPIEDGTANQALITNGFGVLSWGNTLAGTLVHPSTTNTFEYQAITTLTTGDKNTILGVEAGSSITSGTGNVGLGYRSLKAVTSAQSNTAIGESALNNCATGSNNTAIGNSALYRNPSSPPGNYECNTAIGSSAGGTGNNNVAVGFSALIDANTESVVAIGYNAGNSIIATNSQMIGSLAIASGQYNTVIGHNINISSVGSVIIGNDSSGGSGTVTANDQFVLGTLNHKYQMHGKVETALSLSSTDAGGQVKFYESTLTYYAGLKANSALAANVTWTLPALDGTNGKALVTDGLGNLSFQTPAGTLVHPNTSNTFEYQAVTTVTTGAKNTAIGVEAGYSLTTGEFNTLYGYRAGKFLKTAPRNTLIGTESGSNLSDDNGPATGNTFVGMYSGSGMLQGSKNVFIGDTAGNNFSSGSYNTAINSPGCVPSSALNGVVSIGYDSSGLFATASANNQFVLGTSNHKYQMPGYVETVLKIAAHGTSPGQAGEMRLYEIGSPSTSDYIALRAPDTLDSTIIWTLPDDNGVEGYTLTNNGSGGLSWSETADAEARARLDQLEESRGVYTGNIQTGSTMNISSLIGTSSLEYPIVQIYKNVLGVYENINVEFSFNSSTNVITFGEVADGPISVVIHVLALTEPLTTLSVTL